MDPDSSSSLYNPAPSRTSLPAELILEILEPAVKDLQVQARQATPYKQSLADTYAQLLHSYLKQASLVAPEWRPVAQELLLKHGMVTDKS